MAPRRIRKRRIIVMNRSVTALCLSVLLSIIVVSLAFTAYAQSVAAKTPVTKGPVKEVNKHFSIQTITYSDGSMLNRSQIKGPPVPPPGYELERAAVALPEPNPAMRTNSLGEVPAYMWVFGCSAVSGAMIAGYHDRTTFPNMYAGPTDGGVIPLTEDSSWGTWTDIKGDQYPSNPLIASHNGLDGRATPGSIDDYWVSYLSNARDPYITKRRTQHAWGDAIGDYMKTSQSAYSNVDGSTTFYYYPGSATQLTCENMESSGIADEDGTYGRKLFYEARGYAVTDCYTQNTDNQVPGGFSFAQYKAEIDAGRPVMLQLEGHTVVGVGYEDPSTVYLHDTWDYGNHTMTWGDEYSGMTLWGVSIVNPQASPSVTADLAGSWSDVSRTTSSKRAYTVSATFTTTNTGSASANNVVVYYYFSRDNKLDNKDIWIESHSYGPMVPGGRMITTINYSTTSSPKGKYLIAFIDPLNSVPESNETNNIVSTIIP
jgi:hypothetical protein